MRIICLLAPFVPLLFRRTVCQAINIPKSICECKTNDDFLVNVAFHLRTTSTNQSATMQKQDFLETNTGDAPRMCACAYQSLHITSANMALRIASEGHTNDHVTTSHMPLSKLVIETGYSLQYLCIQKAMYGTAHSYRARMLGLYVMIS